MFAKKLIKFALFRGPNAMILPDMKDQIFVIFDIFKLESAHLKDKFLIRPFLQEHLMIYAQKVDYGVYFRIEYNFINLRIEVLTIKYIFSKHRIDLHKNKTVIFFLFFKLRSQSFTLPLLVGFES